MQDWIRKILKWLAIFAGAIAIAVLLRGFGFTSYLIPSEGMENSLLCGDRVLVNKWSYGLRTPLMRWFGYHRWNSRTAGRGDIVVFNNPADLGSPYIDRRETYISRCTGIPGDTLWVDSLFSLIPSENRINPDRKQLYAYPREYEGRMDSLLTLLSITGNDLMGQDSARNVRGFSLYEYYLLEQALDTDNWIQRQSTDSHARPLIIPGKGKPVRVYPWNIVLLRNMLMLHENKQAEIIDDTLYIEGEAVQECIFSKDYYWMVSDNSVNLSDSRLFGFLPQDHLIGKAMLIWLSKEPDTSLLKGFRWNRFFQTVE